MPLCLRLLPNFSPLPAPIRGASAASGEQELFKRLSIYFLPKKKKKKKSTHSQSQQWSGAHCTYSPALQGCPSRLRIPGRSPISSPALVPAPLRAPELGTRGCWRGKNLGRAHFGVWAFPPRSLATKSRRSPPNRLRPLERGGLKAGAPALPWHPRPLLDRKKREEQRGP